MGETDKNNRRLIFHCLDCYTPYDISRPHSEKVLRLLFTLKIFISKKHTDYVFL